MSDSKLVSLKTKKTSLKDVNKSFPNSKKIYITGSRSDIKVPMREISQSDTFVDDKRVKNVDFQVYDTSGFYSDPDVPVDVNRGLKHVRDSWIAERKDTKQLEEHSSDYSKKIKKEPDDFSSFKGKFLPRVAARGKNVSQMHYAKKE